MKYLNKNIWKNALLIIVAILLVGGSFVLAEYKNTQSKDIYTAPNISATSDIDLKAQEVDTDGDGSKDWEEILVGTNPNDPKSKPSASKSVPATDLTKTPTEELQPIDLVSREFFARYMELRQLGESKNTLNQKDLAEKTVSGIVLSKPAVYKIDEIITKQDSTSEAIKNYGEQVAFIFKKYSIKSRNEAVIARDALQKENPETLKEIDPIIVSYKNIINALLKVSTPKPIAIMHLDLINALNSNLFVAQSFRNTKINPIEGVQALQYYTVAAKSLYDAITAIKSYFKYLGIYENIS